MAMQRQGLIISAGVLPIAIIALFPLGWWVGLLVVANVLALVCVSLSALLLVHRHRIRQEEMVHTSPEWAFDQHALGKFQNN